MGCYSSLSSSLAFFNHFASDYQNTPERAAELKIIHPSMPPSILLLWVVECYSGLTLLHSERPKLHTSAIGLTARILQMVHWSSENVTLELSECNNGIIMENMLNGTDQGS